MEKKLATSVTTVTLVGFIKYSFPMKTDNDEHYRIVNFNHENLEELLEKQMIEFPITIGVVGGNVAVILDSRIPDEWYSQKFCTTCTPMDLLPLPQRIKQLLDIDRGIREEREIEINGEKLIMTSVKVNSQIKPLEMTEEQKDNWGFLNNKMKNEGFHYCFKHYSSWKEIEDEKFHELKQNYLKSAEELEGYVKNKLDEIYSNELNEEE